jgi:hypothetical protein
MARFRRFTLGKEQPIEIYEGDSMKLKKGYVKILNGDATFDLYAEQRVAGIRLDMGQSVRQIDSRAQIDSKVD